MEYMESMMNNRLEASMSEYEQMADRIAQLEAELAQSQAALKMAREWSKGDKWRFSEVAQEYAAWENYVDVLDAAIKEQQ